jgi:hypothetical protein
MDEETFEHDPNVLRLAERALDLRPSSSGAHDDEVARAKGTGALAVDENGDVRDEERLADEVLAALVDLDD